MLVQILILHMCRASSSAPSDKTNEERDLELLDTLDTTDKYGFPSEELCARSPRKFRETSNTVLSILAAQGVHGARKERLLREIVRADKVGYLEAREILEKINHDNDK